MKFSARFEGGDELARNLATMSPRVSKRVLLEALMVGAEPIRRRASSNAPHDPGAPDLRNNIVVSTVRVPGVAAAVAIGPSKEFFYGLFNELGTVHQGARPFLRPAFDSEGVAALGPIGQELWRALASRGFSRTVDGARTNRGFV